MKWCIIAIVVIFLPTGYSYFDWISDKVSSLFGSEVCDDKHISPNFHQLRENLKKSLFGQDLVIDKLIPALETHFKVEPKKALVICMHGWTGIGKNYATQIVIETLFKKKFDSEFVRVFNGRLHFPINIEEYVSQYKLNVQSWVKGNVTKCPRSLFVFDEVDKIPAGVLDALKPFFDYYTKVDLIDFRKSIFIFISNIGAEVINSRYVELWRQGKSREDMKYKDFEPYLKKALYSTKGGFKGSPILEAHLVSLYLPFLPLGEEEVRQCIEAELKRQNVDPVTDDVITSVLEEMEFNYDRFSLSGCKRVSDVVTNIKYKRRFGEL